MEVRFSTTLFICSLMIGFMVVVAYLNGATDIVTAAMCLIAAVVTFLWALHHREAGQ